MTSGTGPTDTIRSLAQINVARLRVPEGDPIVADFFANLDRINALAESSDGFIWRLKDEAGNATGIQATPDPLLIINMSVWRDIEALRHFVYRSAHSGIMRRRTEWFEPLGTAHQALWWVEAEQMPTESEGMARLALLREHGPTREAFTFATAGQFND